MAVDGGVTPHPSSLKWLAALPRLSYYDKDLVEAWRVALQFPHCERGVLLLNYAPGPVAGSAPIHSSDEEEDVLDAALEASGAEPNFS